MTVKSATVFAPGSIGNVGPGFDILGLAVDGIGDHVTVERASSHSAVVVRGRDAEMLPTDPAKNAAAIAAAAMLRRFGRSDPMKVTVDKGLPVSGGIGGSAASSVAGASAASLAFGLEASIVDIMAAALEGEMFVSGRHLDNIAPITLGGLVLSRSIDPIDAIPLPVPQQWSVALIMPGVRIETKQALSLIHI